MRFFIYKLLITLIGIFILFQVTIGLVIKEAKKNIAELSSKEKVFELKEKIREEISNGIQKDRILDAEDARLLKLFYNKIFDEITSQDK
tara:strand:+ start:713 stop:979 length:267 start_codon:yes stop_codon:yes gene_type:complete